ncbi:MAG: hypothetical protein LBR26_13580 [Prevotella sp.]|jgi:hypothetical protein|nr:hypothetical protein [Prevotella sp.]
MKKLLFVCMALSLPLIFSACSNDDDEKVNNSIVGTWKFKDVVAGEIQTNSPADRDKIAKWVTDRARNSFGNRIYTFAANGALQLKDSEETDTGTYTFEDGTLMLVWGNPVDDDNDVYKGTVENDILVIEDDFTKYCNGLELELDELINLGLGNPTDFEATKVTARMSFSRQ